MKPKTNKGSNKQLEEYKKEYLLVTNLYKELYTDYNGLNEEQLLNNEEKILHEIISIITKTISITKRRAEIDIYLKELETINKRLLAVTNRMEELGVNIYNHSNHINTDLQRLFIMMSCNSKLYTKQHQDKLKDAIVVINAIGNRSMHGGADGAGTGNNTVTIQDVTTELSTNNNLADYSNQNKQLNNVLDVEHLGIKYRVIDIERGYFELDIDTEDILHIKTIDANKAVTTVHITGKREGGGDKSEEAIIPISAGNNCCLEYYTDKEKVETKTIDITNRVMDIVAKMFGID